MRRAIFAFVGVVLATGTWAVGAGEAPQGVPAPWSIAKVTRSEQAEPGADGKAADAPGSKYLHIRLALSPKGGDLKLHQFRITDAKGKTVAELYGFHKGRSALVFEGNWSRLERLYLDGGGHREPLIPAPPPVWSESPVVMSRRSSRPSAGAKREGVEPAGPILHARQGKPARRPTAVEPPPKGEELYQEVLVTQRSRVRFQGIQGLDFDGDLQYRVLSSLTIERRNADGSLAVAQKVQQANVIKADPLTQSVVGELLGKLVGTTFQISVEPDGHVVDFQGAKGRIRAGVLNGPLGGQSFLMVSILDPDGWREIAELTFFRPPMISEGGQIWDRAIAHSWGPLGSWSGKIAYSRAGQEGATDRFRYSFKLAYEAPKSGASGLPFQTLRADFRHQEAGGSIAFDKTKGRVVEAKEHFPVQGNLTIGLLGQQIPVGLDETQDFRIRIFQRPKR